MDENKNSLESISIRYGLLSTLGLIAYFLIMKIVGLVYMVELRTLNFIILLAGIYTALKKFQKTGKEPVTYLNGMALGTLTSAIAVIPFAIFIFVYLQVDNGLMEVIKNRDSFGTFLNPYMLAFVIGFEGIFSGLILTFILMQWMRKSHTKGEGIQ